MTLQAAARKARGAAQAGRLGKPGNAAGGRLQRSPAGPGQVVASLVEFSPRLAGRGLYAPAGVPRLRVADLESRALQGARPGRFGLQRFFSQSGRAFSLYVMAREGPRLEHALDAMNASLRSLAVGVG